jgi:branched-chain amino acid transport system substrate-binding protein
MTKPSSFTRRGIMLGTAGVLFAPAIARAAQRGVSDTEIVVGAMADLSGVTAVQGVNNADAMRMAYDEINAKGGINGRKIRFIVEDNEYTVPKAVQAMNKLLNRDSVFFCVGNGGTPMNDACMPMMFEKGVPNVFPTTCARTMFEPFNKYKFGQFSSYYDQMRSGVKHFASTKGIKVVGAMYQDTDFGRDVLAGAQAQVEAMNLKMGATTGHKPTDTDFNANVAKLRDANCELVVLGTIVKDTVLILQTAHKMGYNPIFMGTFASYSTAVAEAPGGPAEGFYSMSPAPYRYPDDTRPSVHAFATKFKSTYGIDVNYLGEAGYTAAQFTIAALQKAGRDLTTDSFIAAMDSMKDWRDIFDGPPLSLSPTDHHASNQSFLSMVKDTRWTPVIETPLSF